MTPTKSPKKSVFIGVCGLRPEIVEALKSTAKKTNRSVSGLVRAIIEDSFSAPEQEGAGK